MTIILDKKFWGKTLNTVFFAFFTIFTNVSFLRKNRNKLKFKAQWQHDMGNFNCISCKSYVLFEILSKGIFISVLVNNYRLESKDMNIHTMLPRCIKL